MQQQSSSSSSSTALKVCPIKAARRAFRVCVLTPIERLYMAICAVRTLSTGLTSSRTLFIDNTPNNRGLLSLMEKHQFGTSEAPDETICVCLGQDYGWDTIVIAKGIPLPNSSISYQPGEVDVPAMEGLLDSFGQAGTKYLFLAGTLPMIGRAKLE